MPRPVLLDVDTGIDDALALMLAVRSEEIELVGVGTVAGNVDAMTAARNTLRVLEVAGAGHVPVAVGATAPLIEPFQDAAWVHGSDGMGNSSQPEPTALPSDETAVEQLLRLSHEHSSQLTVVAVGPLTNLALAIRGDPELPARLRRIVIMGGSARAGGNRSSWAEANMAQDPEAATVVFGADVPRTMVGLDVTMQVTIGQGDIAALAASGDPCGELAAQILPHYLDVYESWSGQRRCALHDPLAVAVAARPDLVVTRSLPVAVETVGRLTRGMTVVDLRALMPGAPVPAGPRTDVALEVNGRAFLEHFRQRLSGSSDGLPVDGP